jgi:hypothetical protein
MSTTAQINANRLNAQSSTGPTSEEGKAASSQNRTTHGLCHDHTCFYFVAGEDPEKYAEIHNGLQQEHQPQTETERVLVRHMAQHEWLRTRALLLQRLCFDENLQVKDTRQLALFLRYQTTHERAFYKVLKELQNIRSQRINQQIGLESQKRQQAVEQRAAEAHNLKKQEFEIKKERLASPKQPENSKKDVSESSTSQNRPAPAPATSPGGLEMAA